MKKQFIFWLALSACSVLQAQNNLYASFGADFSRTFRGGSFHFTVQNDRMIIQTGGLGTFMHAASTPSDFIEPDTDLSFLNGQPLDAHLMAHISGGASFSINDFVRINLLAGIGNSWYREPTNWQQDGPIDEPGNYDFEYQSTEAIGLILHPTLEFPLTRPMGLSVAPLVIFNERGTQVFFEVSLMLGKVRESRD